MAIHLVTVVGGPACIGTLPHMLSHYAGLGVDSVVLNVHAPTRDDDTPMQVAKIAAAFGISVNSIVVGPWSQGVNPMLYGLARLSRQNDWWIMADHDEFQVYPDELSSIIDFAERRGYSYIEGCFIDRVADRGTLAPVQRELEIWRQYPIGCLLSANLLRANPHKIVVARGSVRVGPGQHRALSRAGCPPLKYYVPVHHFKWTAGAEAMLADRVAVWSGLNEPYWEESARFLEHLKAHGVIDLDNPLIRAARCDPDYPYWKSLIEERLLDPNAGKLTVQRRASP